MEEKSLKANMIYVISNEIFSPIVESQVYRPLSNKVSQTTGRGCVVALLPIGYLLRKNLKTRLAELRKRFLNLYGVDTHVVYGGNAALPFRGLQSRMLARRLKQLTAGKESIVYGRNATAMAMVVEARRGHELDFEAVFDCRGDEPYEVVGGEVESWGVKEWSVSQQQRFQDKFDEQKIASEADKVHVVSESMGTVLIKRHGVDPKKIKVFPCAVDLSVFPKPDKQRARTLLEISENRFVVCYLGSLVWYQLPDQGIRLFRIIQSVVPNAFYLGITPDPETLGTYLNDAGIKKEDFRVVSLASKDVASRLAAADLGLLLRESNPVNKVASPVKFAEYLACGVPVLISSGIGDYSTWVENESIGITVDFSGSDEVVEEQIRRALDSLVSESEKYQKRSRAVVEDRLSLQLEN